MELHYYDCSFKQIESEDPSYPEMMKRIQKAIFAEPPILQQYSCQSEQVPHLFLVKKEDNQELLHDLIENQEHSISDSSASSSSSPTRREEAIHNTHKKRIIHYDHRFYDHDVQSKYCDVLVHPAGWKFYSFHRHILQEHEIQQLLIRMKNHLLESFPSLSQELPSEENRAEWVANDHLNLNGFKLHVPPVLFGIDVMFLEFHPPSSSSSSSSSEPSTSPVPSQFAIAVDPSDSIYSWVVKHCKENLEKHSLNIPRVPYSEKWLKNIQEEFKVTTVDPSNRTSSPTIPTTSSPITITTTTTAASHSPPLPNASSIPAPDRHHKRSNSIEAAGYNGSLKREDSITLTHIQASDWTYSTDYCATLFLKSIATSETDEGSSTNGIKADEIYSIKQLLRAQELSSPPSDGRYTIQPIPQSGIDYEMLKRRDLPILFYDEILLYEDDLEDCGEVSMEAKIRVMPTCWFVLTKFFVRVDNVIVRSRETRMFHEFPQNLAAGEGKTKIFMEVIWREKDLNNDTSVPTSPLMSPMTNNLHTSLSSLQGGLSPNLGVNHHHYSTMPPPPMMMKKYTKDNIQEIPIINQREGIYPNYLLEIH